MSEIRRRQHIVMVRLDDSELAELAEKSASAGLSKPSYFRRSMLGRRIDHDARSKAEAFRELNRIGQNLNQLTRLGHLGQDNQEDIAAALAAVRDAAAKVGES